METRKMNVIFTKGGSGSVTTKLAIPKSWMDKIGVTQEEREVVLEFDGERILVRKMNKTDKLIERIDKAIEKKISDTGCMGTETVTVFVMMTDEEKEIFHDIDKYDSEHYFWEIDGNELIISYTEEV